MKTRILFTLAALFLASCATPPKPAQSSHFRAEFAGYTWKKDGSARARFSLTVLETTPRPLYVEAILPSPNGGRGDTVRKVISSGDSSVSFDGPFHTGWKSGSIYVFQLRTFSDSSYRESINMFEQRSLCTKPPDSLLKQLKDEL